MTPQLMINLCDSAIYNATDRVKELLCLLGQDKERGYRNALKTIFDSHPTYWFYKKDNYVEHTVTVLNLVVAGIDFDARLNEDKKADLISFFIQRIKHTEIKV